MPDSDVPEPDVTEPDLPDADAPEPEAGIVVAPEKELSAPRTDMTVGEMREWLRNWVANAVGQPAE